jgi:hypothetical protein
MVQVVLAVAGAEGGATAAEDDGTAGAVGDVAEAGFVGALGYC